MSCQMTKSVRSIVIASDESRLEQFNAEGDAVYMVLPEF